MKKLLNKLKCLFDKHHGLETCKCCGKDLLSSDPRIRKMQLWNIECSRQLASMLSHHYTMPVNPLRMVDTVTFYIPPRFSPLSCPHDSVTDNICDDCKEVLDK